MSNFSLSPLFRRSIGFDRLSDLFDFALQSDTPNFPHYNIEKTGDNNYRISVATAGFNQDQLEINLENKVLTITGKIVEEKTIQTLNIYIRESQAVHLSYRYAWMNM